MNSSKKKLQEKLQYHQKMENTYLPLRGYKNGKIAEKHGKIAEKIEKNLSSKIKAV